VRLKHSSPFDGRATFAWLGARAIPGVEHVAGNTYARTLRLGHGPAVVQLQPSAGEASISMRAWLTDASDIPDAVHRCRKLLDLDADSDAIDRRLSADPVMASLVASRPGLRVPGAVDGFELAVRAVLGQQVSLAAARTFAGRVTHECGTAVECAHPQLTHLFPAPENLVDVATGAIGVTTSRGHTLCSLARAVSDDGLSLDSDHKARNETLQRVRALPGIGEWTASYIAMRAFADPDVLPAGDLGVLRAARRLGLPDTRRQLIDHSMRWRPWRSYATMHLWAAQG